jgi:hypothetical protein
MREAQRDSLSDCLAALQVANADRSNDGASEHSLAMFDVQTGSAGAATAP